MSLAGVDVVCSQAHTQGYFAPPDEYDIGGYEVPGVTPAHAAEPADVLGHRHCVARARRVRGGCEGRAAVMSMFDTSKCAQRFLHK